MNTDAWPKELIIYTHKEKYNYAVEEWLEKLGLDFDSPLGQKLAYIAYETKHTYLVYEDGRYELTHVNDRPLKT